MQPVRMQVASTCLMTVGALLRDGRASLFLHVASSQMHERRRSLFQTAKTSTTSVATPFRDDMDGMQDAVLVVSFPTLQLRPSTLASV